MVTSAPASGLSPAVVDVRFGTATDWDKEVTARNLCNGVDIARLFARGRSTNPSTLRVPMRTDPTNGADSLVFRKPGFWGIWIDSAHFEPSAFWTAFGGRTITITWLSD